MFDVGGGVPWGGDPGGSTYLGSQRITAEARKVHSRYDLPELAGVRGAWRPVWAYLLEHLPPGESREIWLRRGRRFLLCGTPEGPQWVYQCPDCGDYVLVAQTCSMKACPDCSTIQTLRWRRGIEEFLLLAKERNKRVRHLVLTVPSRPQGELALQLRFLEDSLRRMKQRKAWGVHVLGAIVVFEVTYREAGWHAHAHVLYAGEFWPWAAVAREWVAATCGEAGVAGVSISAASSHRAAEYAAKGMDPFYLLKGSGAPESVPLMAEFILATWKVKLYREWGLAYGCAPPDDYFPFACPRCGGNHLRRISCVWGEANALRHIEELREKDKPSLPARPLTQGGAYGVH